MSGFAAINGEPDGAPLPPPIALTDEVTALVGAFAVLAALRHRDRTGEGQVVDVNLLDTMLSLMGPLHSAWAHLGYEQPRLGSGIPYSVPRGTYRCRDGRWVAVSASAESVAARLMELLGVGRRPALRDVREPGRAPRRARRDRAGLGRAPATTTTSSPRSRPRTRRSRPCTRWPTSPPTRTSGPRDSLVTVDGVTMPGLIARFSAHARARSAARAGRSAPTPTRCSPSSTRPSRDAATGAGTRDAPRSVGVENRTWMRAPTTPRGGYGVSVTNPVAFPTTGCGQPWGRAVDDRWTTAAALGTTVWTTAVRRRGCAPRGAGATRPGPVRSPARCPQVRPQPARRPQVVPSASSPGRPQVVPRASAGPAIGPGRAARSSATNSPRSDEGGLEWAGPTSRSRRRPRARRSRTLFRDAVTGHGDQVALRWQDGDDLAGDDIRGSTATPRPGSRPR